MQHHRKTIFRSTFCHFFSRKICVNHGMHTYIIVATDVHRKTQGTHPRTSSESGNIEVSDLVSKPAASMGSRLEAAH